MCHPLEPRDADMGYIAGSGGQLFHEVRVLSVGFEK